MKIIIFLIANFYINVKHAIFYYLEAFQDVQNFKDFLQELFMIILH